MIFLCAIIIKEQTMTSTDYRTLLVSSIDQETDKAYKMTIKVSWNGNIATRSFWFPKSVVMPPVQEGWAWSVKSWFADKLEKQNIYHGYIMNIEG